MISVKSSEMASYQIFSSIGDGGTKTCVQFPKFLDGFSDFEFLDRFMATLILDRFMATLILDRFLATLILDGFLTT